ncbi:hypothetical protein I314_01990 [Cryptococcus bacillisporus CA1873]|uniref:Uncharacterized protein n=1 Tax=Cryptococcus bacillisporus CA1873 TaxID=1296111 RepID=A0ABR5BEG2_CRYGA|nr:hypothetical protein I314_01990 [Cryptococcus bacillisporus CA1873]|eukprot:KIR67573.1 hypothetical protein I314_01990 [Cryptococcus gattii CA1873]
MGRQKVLDVSWTAVHAFSFSVTYTIANLSTPAATRTSFSPLSPPARLGIADSYLSVLHPSPAACIRALARTVSDPSLTCSLRASMSYQPTMAQSSTLPKTGKVSSRRKGSSNPPVMLRSYADPRTSQDALERTQMVCFAQRNVAHTCWPSADRWTRLIRMPTTTSIPFMPVVLLQSHPP